MRPLCTWAVIQIYGYRAFSVVRGFGGVVCKLESLDVPTFAVVNGAALGGGLELIIGCDFRNALCVCH